MTKKTSIAGAYARKAPYEYEGKQFQADIAHGDTVKITNEGTVVTGQFGDQHVFSIQTRNGEKNQTLNQKSINALIDAFGTNSSEWVGRDVKVHLKKDTIAGKKVTIAYLAPEGWVLDEWGELVNETGEPVVQTEELNPEDIPF